MEGHGLWLAYGAFDEDESDRLEIAREIVEALRRHGLNVEWNGSVETRICLKGFDWKRRIAIENETAEVGKGRVG
jgi:hypothetical protein